MKKFVTTISFLLIMSALNVAVTMACTNFIVTRGASVKGSTMITYSADSHVLYGELYYWPARDYPEGTMLDVYEWDTRRYLGKIRQVPHTYSVVRNMNEHQLSIGETTYTGIESLIDTTGIIDYGSLIYITCRGQEMPGKQSKPYLISSRSMVMQAQENHFQLQIPMKHGFSRSLAKGLVIKARYGLHAVSLMVMLAVMQIRPEFKPSRLPPARRIA